MSINTNFAIPTTREQAQLLKNEVYTRVIELGRTNPKSIEILDSAIEIMRQCNGALHPYPDIMVSLLGTRLILFENYHADLRHKKILGVKKLEISEYCLQTAHQIGNIQNDSFAHTGWNTDAATKTIVRHYMDKATRLAVDACLMVGEAPIVMKLFKALQLNYTYETSNMSRYSTREADKKALRTLKTHVVVFRGIVLNMIDAYSGEILPIPALEELVAKTNTWKLEPVGTADSAAQ